MGTLGNMDGSFDGVLKASEQLKGLPKIIQKYMTAGIFQDELGWAKHFDDDSIDKLGGVDSFIVQIMNLDKAQQDALLSVSKFSDGLKEEIERLLQAAQAGEKFNTQLFEQEASKDDKLSKGVLNEVMQTTGMKDADGNYLLPNTKDVCDLLEQYANDANNAQKAQELFNAGLLEQSDNGYKVSASLLKLIGAKKSDIVTTGIATAGQMAWNYAMQIGKQLLLSLGVAAVTFIATKLVDYIMNLKTHSEELVDAMNDSHDAAQQATKDVEEIQSKIDELNKSLKDAGVKKIEDIVDPAERERLQAINDMLQAQLELKKQLEKDANDKANADTSAVVNDKTEDSIVKSRTVNVSYAEGGANAGAHQVAEKVSKTESLEEHAAALNDLIDKRRELATAGKEDTQEYKDNEAAITAETEKVEGLSSAVSKQMDSYETDADSFAKYKDEYVAGTNSITAATKALANANDDVGVSTTNYDILLQKMQAVKNLMDRRNKDVSSSNPYTSAVKTLKTSGLETGDDIRELSIVPANQTKEQAAAIAVLQKAADDAHVTLDQFISALESVGLIAVRNANNIKSLSDAMSVLDNMQSAYQSCAAAVKEYNKTGYVSMDTLQSLCQLEPQYLNMLDLKNGKLKINTKTAQTLTQANLQLAKASILADTLNNIKDTNNLAKAEALLGDVTAVISDADTAIDAATEKSAQQAKDSDGWAGYDKVKRAGAIYKKNYHTLSGLLDDLGKQDPSKIWGKDDTSKATKQATSAIDAWSTLSSAMEEYTGASILWLKLKQASISDGTKFSFVCPEDVAIDARVCIENLITTIRTNPDGKGEYKDVSRAVYGPMMLFQAVTNEDGEDEPEDTSVLKKGRYYVIQYKNRLEYLLPFDTGLTSEAGDIEFQLTFIHVEMDSEGQTIQRVRKAGPGVVHIIPISKWSDLIPDEALSTLDQRIIALEALNKAMTDRFNTSLANKADNITYDEEHRIQLTSEGKPIGNAIKITTETVETEDGSMRVVPF